MNHLRISSIQEACFHTTSSPHWNPMKSSLWCNSYRHDLPPSGKAYHHGDRADRHEEGAIVVTANLSDRISGLKTREFKPHCWMVNMVSRSIGVPSKSEKLPHFHHLKRFHTMKGSYHPVLGIPSQVFMKAPWTEWIRHSRLALQANLNAEASMYIIHNTLKGCQLPLFIPIFSHIYGFLRVVTFQNWAPGRSCSTTCNDGQRRSRTSCKHDLSRTHHQKFKMELGAWFQFQGFSHP